MRFPVARASLCLSLSIDTSAPATSKLKHMRCNHKRNKLNEERTQLIERDNSLLVQRMMAIMDGDNDVRCTAPPAAAESVELAL